MRFEESILIHATPDQVFEKAADLEGYSSLAEEYRQSRVVSRQGNEAVVERRARIAGLPFTWRSHAKLTPPESIEFRQVSGPLRGMVTSWRIAACGEPGSAAGGQTQLSITHDLSLAPGPVGNWLAAAVYRLFIKKLVLKILANLKASLERAPGD